MPKDYMERLSDVIDQRDELKEILKDLCDLDAEYQAVGGGPGYKQRSEKAWQRAHEVFQP